jgi:hypothetical protein
VPAQAGPLRDADVPPQRSRARGAAASRVETEYKAREARLKKYRTVVGFVGLVPLVGSLACDGGLLLLCIPWSWYMAVWAAVFGAFVGLTIRLVRERRQFEAHRSRAS